MSGVLLALLLAIAKPNDAEAQFRQAESVRASEPWRARTLYEKSARLGYAPAQASLGLMLFKDGNRTVAMRWLKAAADAGEPRAMLAYGTALFNGDGVPTERVRGYVMVARAAAARVPAAETTRSEMELVMPPTELSAANQLVRVAAAKVAPQSTVPPVAAKAVVNPTTGTRPRGKSRRASATTQTVSARAPTVAPPSAAVTPTPATSGPWRIQLGAFRQAGAGQALFARMAPRLPGKRASFVPMGSLTRVLVGPYASFADAAAACRALGRQQACMPIKS